MGDPYFLPKALVSILVEECAKTITSTEVTIEADGFQIPGFALTGKASELERFIAEAPVYGLGIMEALNKCRVEFELTKFKSDLGVRGTGKAGGQSYSLLGPAPFMPLSIFETGCTLIQADMEDLYRDIKGTLEKLSSWSALEIHLFAPQTSSVRSYKTAKNALAIVLDASPPGHAPRLKDRAICGIPLSDDGISEVAHAGPARGRGGIIEYKEYPIAQIVEGTLYLFVPLHKKCAKALMDKGDGLFKHALRLAWNARFTEPQPLPTAEITTSAEYREQLQRQAALAVKPLEEQLKGCNQELAETESKLRELLSEKRVLTTALQGNASLQNSIDWTEREKEWEKLRSLSGVERVMVIDEGIHVETRALIASHEGRKYQLGSYAIRFAEGTLSLWSISTPHPTGRMHPHIMDAGNMCFGNITIAVQKAAIEMDVIHVVELVLRWLTEGYDPELAEVHIEEWPLVEESNV